MFLNVGELSMSELLRLLDLLRTALASVAKLFCFTLFVMVDGTLIMVVEISGFLLLVGLRRLRSLGSLGLPISAAVITELFCLICV